MAMDRARPAQDAGEQEMLTGWLEHHRGILIVTHMIEEYARHNGHADLLRERVDGSTGYY